MGGYTGVSHLKQQSTRSQPVSCAARFRSSNLGKRTPAQKMYIVVTYIHWGIPNALLKGSILS